jgi:hypothetical protein
LPLLGVLAVFATAGCTSPQSGIYAAEWCLPGGTVDDMEDGDGVLCEGRGSWSLASHEATTDLQTGPLAATEILDVPAPAGSKRSLRGIRFSASGFMITTGFERPWAVLTAEFNSSGTVNLNDFEKIRFRALSQDRAVQLRIGVVTGATSEPAGATACDMSYPDHWGRTATLQAATNWSMVEVEIASLLQQGCQQGQMRPSTQLQADLMDTRGVELRYAPFFLGVVGGAENPNNGPNAFDIWIDDLQLVAPGG